MLFSWRKTQKSKKKKKKCSAFKIFYLTSSQWEHDTVQGYNIFLLLFLEFGHVINFLAAHCMDVIIILILFLFTFWGICMQPWIMEAVPHYVDEFTGTCRISTALGRCTWPCDLACHVFLCFLLPLPLWLLCPSPPNICACSLLFTCSTYENGCFFSAVLLPVWIAGAYHETGFDAHSCWGVESCCTCQKILKLLECVWIGLRCVKIEKLVLLGEMEEGVCRQQIS